MNRVIFFVCLFSAIIVSSFSPRPAAAQLPTGWKAHDLKRPAPPVVDPGESKLPTGVPSDAIVLFDGSDLSKWTDAKGGEPKWKVVDGAMESVPRSGYIFTKDKFGDCQLHVEWATPVTVKGDSQGRGNSGVYLMGKYEVQVLDSFENPTYADGSAGSIYGQYPPLVNVSRRPGEWQSYDIIFHQAKFDESGNKTAAARLTVLHNGVLVQDHSEVFGPTNWIQVSEDKPGPTELPLSLQDHGNPVRYRNIWIRPLQDRARPEQPYASETSAVEISAEAMAAVSGDFEGFRIENRDGVLLCHTNGSALPMIPLSETKFEFSKSAGSIEFTKNESGAITAGTIQLDAAGTRTGKKK